MSGHVLSLTSLPVPETNQTNLTKPTPETDLNNLVYTFKSPFELKQVHAQLIKTNTSPSILRLTHVAAVCALTPSFPYARKMIQFSGKPETVIWNSCLKEFAQSDSPNDAIRLFCQLYECDVCLDEFTFSFLIKACTKLSGGLDGRIIHGFIEKLGFQYNLFLQNSLVHLYAVSGEINGAGLLFDKMPERDC